MITYTDITGHGTEARLDVEHAPAHELFAKIRPHYQQSFLLESVEVSLFSGRFSLMGVDPCVEVSGKDHQFQLRAISERGHSILKELADELSSYADEIHVDADVISGVIEKDTRALDEQQRSKRRCAAQVLRIVLEKYHSQKKILKGLYGAMTYDFVRQFEDLGNQLPATETQDFRFFVYDTFILLDHIKEVSSIVVYRDTQDDCLDIVHDLEEHLMNEAPEGDYTISQPHFSLQEKDFTDMVEKAKEYIRQGDIFQVVFSNILKADFAGDPFQLYLKYREKNPSPYLFFYDFGDEQLVGASPEMMIRCEDHQVHLRPIAGTITRGDDQVADHDQLIALLNDPKERAELDMLIDLGRNDLSRICKPGIEISDYRFVEKYSRVMHTVAHLTGELKDGHSGLDALFSSMNAGTLTGAPKISAMKIIERHEQERRQYYGGAVGQLSFSGEVDTAILIRTAHIKNGALRYQSGAGIVYDSDPQKELQESLNKAQAFLDTFSDLSPDTLFS